MHTIDYDRSWRQISFQFEVFHSSHSSISENVQHNFGMNVSTFAKLNRIRIKTS